jgi:hypothetical protein
MSEEAGRKLRKISAKIHSLCTIFFFCARHKAREMSYAERGGKEEAWECERAECRGRESRKFSSLNIFCSELFVKYHEFNIIGQVSDL